MSFDPIVQKSISEQVAQRLLTMIRSGLLKPDQQLPPERELAAMLGVGRPAVREAIRGLALLGLLRIRQGEGTFVSSMETRELLEPLEMIIDLNPGTLEALFDARLIIETGVAALAATHMEQAELDRLVRNVEDEARLLSDPAAFSAADVEFHEAIIEGCNNPFLQSVAGSLYMLGKKQHDWLRSSMAASDADFFFLASSVNLMIPHIGSPGSKDPIAGKDDAWTAFTAEREELIQFWDSLKRPVIIMTGDLHNSWAVKVTDTVWEFAAGPHNSQNHPLVSEGSRPINGKFDSRGRECDIRWSSFILNDVPGKLRHFPIYAIAQINNVYQNPDSEGKERWVAYPRPHLVIQYYDGFSGDLLYAEAVHRK